MFKVIIHVTASSFLLMLLLGAPRAYERDPLAEVQLYDLFIGLQNAQDQAAAKEYENKIWQLWFRSGDADIDQLMQESMQRRRVYDFNGALELLNEVIGMAPQYPEGWNQRATVYFFQQEYEKSLEDVARVLELEPRHFGAMAGRAVIRLYQLKPALARQNIIEALKIHPYLPERRFFPDLVAE